MKTKKILLNSLPLLFVGGIMAYAAAPTGGYLPNATLDPDCAPNDTDCFVQIADDLTSVWDNADGSVADETSTNINYVGGNVGIGFTNPEVTLDIRGNGNSNGYDFYLGDGPGLSMGGDVTSGSASYINSTTNLYFNAGEVLNPGDDPTDSDLFISSSGNVGIGTTTPANKLHIFDDGATPMLVQRNNSTQSVGVEYKNDDGSMYSGLNSNEDFGIAASPDIGGISAIATFTKTGNVGIGTTAPDTKLHVSDSAAGGSAPSITATPNGSFTLGANGTSVVTNMGIDGNATSQYFWLQPRLRTSATYYNTALNPNGGNVGIGTIAPAYALHVENNVNNDFSARINNGAGAGQGLLVTAAAPGAVVPILRASTANNAEDIFVVNANGNVGIGTTAPTEKLEVTGNILASGTITPSDRKLKDNIAEIENALDKVNAIGGYTYTLKSTGEEKAGVIAQEIEAVLPEAVNSYDDYKAVEYDMLNALLIEAVQELSERIEELEAAQ